MLQDLRYAVRTLRKAPLFTAVAVFSLALGIGANTAIFTLIDQLILQLLPVSHPEELVLLTARGPHYGSNTGANSIAYPMYHTRISAIRTKFSRAWAVTRSRF